MRSFPKFGTRTGSRRGKKKGVQSVTSRLNRLGKSTTVNLNDEYRALELISNLEMDVLNMITDEQKHYLKATEARRDILKKLEAVRNGMLSEEKQKDLRRGVKLESERQQQEADPEAILRKNRKRLRTITRLFHSITKKKPTESDSVGEEHKSVKQNSTEIKGCVTNNPLHQVNKEGNTVADSPSKSPVKKKSRSEVDHMLDEHIRRLDEDIDVLAKPAQVQCAFDLEPVKKLSFPESLDIDMIDPDTTKETNDHPKGKQANENNQTVIDLSAGGMSVTMDVPTITTTKEEKTLLGLRPEDKTLLAKLILSVSKSERESLKKRLSDLLSSTFRGVSFRALGEMMTNHKKDREQRHERLGRTRALTDDIFIRVLGKLANLDVDCSVGALSVLIEEGRTATAFARGKGMPGNGIPRSTLKRYQQMVMVNCSATSNSQWNTKPRLEQTDSIRSYFTYACLLEALIRRGRPEFRITDEFAKKHPVSPMLTINMDPTTIEFNQETGSSDEVQIHLISNKIPHTQQDSGRHGGHSLTQQYKVYGLYARK